MLKALGYIPHPGLTDGRSNRVVAIDGGKPRLFVMEQHMALQMENPAAIVEAYDKAQQNAAAAQGPGPVTGVAVS